MRFPIAAILVLLAAAGPALAGCGGRSDDTPVACLEGTGAYLTALRAAPGEVALAGGTPISDCLAENQPAGDLVTVGEALVEAATKLDAEARAHPGGAASVALGYLVGAAERGAEHTEGIHAELVRRLGAAASYRASSLPPSFEAAYRRGREAGRDHG